MVRADAQDVAAAHLLLQQGQDAFKAISVTTLKHGISATDIASATAPEDPESGCGWICAAPPLTARAPSSDQPSAVDDKVRQRIDAICGRVPHQHAEELGQFHGIAPVSVTQKESVRSALLERRSPASHGELSQMHRTDLECDSAYVRLCFGRHGDSTASDGAMGFFLNDRGHLLLPLKEVPGRPISRTCN